MIIIYLSIIVVLSYSYINQSYNKIIYKRRKKLYLSDNNDINNGINNDINNDINNKSLEELIDSINNIPQDQVSQDITNAINNKIKERIKENEPSDLEIRMRIMGITPLTIAGFILAGILIYFNLTLGTGWASNLFGLNNYNQQNEQSIYDGLKYRNSQLND